jgi:malonate-semialdehyde dehydrogenase (acetylating)/methylmalonate-semialdehyde dehydrogenase
LPDTNAATALNVSASMSGCAGQRCMAASTMVAVGKIDSIIEKDLWEARKLFPEKLGSVM